MIGREFVYSFLFTQLFLNQRYKAIKTGNNFQNDCKGVMLHIARKETGNKQKNAKFQIKNRELFLFLTNCIAHCFWVESMFILNKTLRIII